MNYARCPACHTLFRVTEEQLEARGGRVRCGQCANVFNALDVPVDLHGAGEEMEGSPSSNLILHLEPEPDPWSVTETEQESSVVPEIPAHSDPATQAVGVEEIEASEVPMPAVMSSGRHPYDQEAVADDEVAREEAPEFLAAAPSGAATQVEEGAAGAQGDADKPDVDAQPAVADWADDRPDLVLPPPPGAGRFWGVAFVLLFFLALLQGVWVFRNDLAVAVPGLRPSLVQACKALGCDMPLPRVAAQIGIEASELRPAGQGLSILKFAATLRNRAAFAQDFPSLELTLTDTDDHVLVRKVFQPGDYLGPKTDRAAGMGAGSDFPLILYLDPGSLSPSGYRLYIFYP